MLLENFHSTAALMLELMDLLPRTAYTVPPVWLIVRPVCLQPYGRTGRANSLDGWIGCFIILGWMD